MFIVAVLLMASASHAQDSFEIVKNGRNYLCTAEAPASPGGAADCASKAYSGPFSQDESVALCQGARDTSPADCANKAYSGPFNKQEAITLCIGAYSTGPADCANKAYSGPFNKDEAVTLCKDNGSTSRADCAIRAYSGPYNKDQAIALCLNQAPLANVALKALVNEKSRGFDAVLKASLDKAITRGELKAKVSNLK